MSQPKKGKSTGKLKRKERSKNNTPDNRNPLPWIIAGIAITAVVFFPMFSNGFTNWDDQLYVTTNPLIIGPDWVGIFSQPVVSNYHPLTIATLALNYQLSQLSPFSYHLVDWVMHLLNTGLVFFLAYRLSEGRVWVGFITALLFGVHPMHVESVAWVSERKDVLYTFFYLLSLLMYEQYMQQKDWKKYTIMMVLFTASLLSKPAAVTLPVVLVLLDWYRGRSLVDKKSWIEKLPFFALAVAFGILTLQIQSEKAIAQPEFYPFWQKIVFAFYGFGEYLRRFFWPLPLSTIHPFPPKAVIPAAYYPALLLTAVTVFLGWKFRRNKNIVLGLGFFTVNLLLVLQLLTFGNSVISERYTYVPYIGLSFALAMLWDTNLSSPIAKNVFLGLFLFVVLVFSVMSFRQVHVWKDSLTLWNKAIEVYPNSYIARSNRGNHLVADLKLYDEGLIDYNIALEAMPDHMNSLENRTIIYLHKENYTAALADAEQFVKFHPDLPRGYFLRAFTLDRLGRPDDAIVDYTRSIELDPLNAEPHANRGVIYYNSKKDYESAKEDFDAAFRLNPRNGEPVLNRARCWINFGNREMALKDLETAKQLGISVSDDLMKAALALK